MEQALVFTQQKILEHLETVALLLQMILLSQIMLVPYEIMAQTLRISIHG